MDSCVSAKAGAAFDLSDGFCEQHRWGKLVSGLAVYQALFLVPFIYQLIQAAQQYPQVDAAIMPILQIRTLRPREVK